MKTKNDTPEVQEPKSDKKSPGFWFYTADYERDMQILSLAAQGLWSRMLCWMSENEAHRGFAELPTGSQLSGGDIASKVGKSLAVVQKLIDEMERVGIFSRDDRGCIYCRRMARDTHISTVRRAAANSRMETSKRAANGSFAGCFAGAKDQAKEEQNPTVTASVPVPVSDLLKPPKPPAPSGADTEAFHVPTATESQGVVRHDVPTEEKEATRKSGKSRNTGGKRTTEEIQRALNGRLPWWEEFWKIYPCHDGMNPAMDAFERRIHDHGVAVELYKAAKRYRDKVSADPTSKVKYAQGWINDERWKDDAVQLMPDQPKSIYTKG